MARKQKATAPSGPTQPPTPLAAQKQKTPQQSGTTTTTKGFSEAHILGWVILGAALLYAIFDSIGLAWVGDDAFITYRYAENLAGGHGLVFNPGERVEGYSNFLWALLLVLPIKMGLDPVLFSQIAGILSFLATVILLAVCGARARGDTFPGVLLFPVAAVGLALHYHARVFATGGLETALFMLLVTAVVCAVIEARGPVGYGLASVLALLTALTRPDGALFLPWPLLGGLLSRTERRRAASLLAAALPAFVAYALYLGWKLQYFGELLPNTFYAKSADRPFYSQGLIYLGSYFRSYWALAPGFLAPLLLVNSTQRKSPRVTTRPTAWLEPRGIVLLSGACLLYLLFVWRVGGDFMFARFALPITPLLLIGTEALIGRLGRGWPQWLAGAAVVGGIWIAAFPSNLQNLGNRTGIVEERFFYPAERVADARRVGAELQQALQGTEARVAIYGSQAMLAYYARFPYVIEAHTGLTDREIARRTIQGRSRVGHEKQVDIPYLRTRDVDLVFNFALYRNQPPDLNKIDIGETNGTVVSYRPQVMRELRRRNGVTFVDFEAHLDEYLTRIGGILPDQVRKDYTDFKTYYFERVSDPERERPFLQVLGNP